MTKTPLADKGLKAEMLNENFFQKILQDRLPGIEVTSISAHTVDATEGNTVAMSGDSVALTGHFGYDVHWKQNGNTGVTRLVIKAKAHSRQLLENVRGYFAAGGSKLSNSFELATPNLQSKTHFREVSIYKEVTDERFRKLTPKIYNTICDDQNEIYIIAMELFENAVQMNKKDPKDWNAEQIGFVMRDMAEIHSIHLENTSKIENRPWCDSLKLMNLDGTLSHWHCVLEYLATEVTDIFTKDRISFLGEMLERYPAQWKSMAQAPLTLTHNNFSPRNMFLQSDQQVLRMKLYDWDMAWIHVPQRDICEFLTWVTTGNPEEILNYVEQYRQNLELHSGRKLPKNDFYEIFEYACCDFVFSKLMIAGVLHKNFKKYPTLNRRLDIQLPLIKNLMNKGLRKSG